MQALHWNIAGNTTRREVYFHGELTRFTLMQAYHQFFPKTAHAEIFTKIPTNATIHWYVADISTLDSAGFAFLCDLLKQSETAGYHVQLSCSEHCLTLAELFGFAHWLKPMLSH